MLDAHIIEWLERKKERRDQPWRNNKQPWADLPPQLPEPFPSRPTEPDEHTGDPIVIDLSGDL